MGVPTKFEYLFRDSEVTYLRIFNGSNYCVYFSLIVHHLEDIGGVKISRGLERSGCKVYFYKISKFQGDVTPHF
jgi:hypothetical protein